MIWPAATLFAVGVIWFAFTLHPMLALMLLIVTSSLVIGEWLYQAQLLPNWMMFALDRYHDRPPQPELDVRIKREETQPETVQEVAPEPAVIETPVEIVNEVQEEPEEAPEAEPEVKSEPVQEQSDSRPAFLAELENHFSVTIIADEELWAALVEADLEDDFRTTLVQLQGMFDTYEVQRSDQSFDLVPK